MEAPERNINFTAIERVSMFNTQATAAVNFLAAGGSGPFQPLRPPSLLRISIGTPGTACRLTMEMTNGGVARNLAFNGNANLATGSILQFDFLTSSSIATIDFQLDVTLRLRHFSVLEIIALTGN